ncbi:MAG: FeoB small GTPase domain-containing protein [Evtepia gabavorous]
MGNWPGVTVERREGGWREDPSVRFVDLPGVYSLSPDTPEEVVTRRFLVEQRPDALLNLVDGTNLERNLYLTTQLLELGIPMVVAVNRADLLERRGQKLNRDLLSRRLGCPVVVLSAARGTGVAEAAQAAAAAARRGEPVKPAPLFPPRARRALEDVEILASDHLPAAGRAWYLVKLFEGDQAVDQALGVGLALRQRLEVVIAACERDLEDDREEIIAAGRYAFAGTLARRCLTRGQGANPCPSVWTGCCSTGFWPCRCWRSFCWGCSGSPSAWWGAGRRGPARRCGRGPGPFWAGSIWGWCRCWPTAWKSSPAPPGSRRCWWTGWRLGWGQCWSFCPSWQRCSCV